MFRTNMWRLIAVVLIWAIAVVPSTSQRMLMTGAGVGTAGGARTCTDGTEAAAFLARTSGLDNTHKDNYCVLINGLVADGVWTSLTALYWFKTQDQTTANLNLVSASFTITPLGSPTFTADVGYTGVEASTTVALDTGLNNNIPSVNDIHYSVFSTTGNQSSATGGTAMGIFDSGLGKLNQIAVYVFGTGTTYAFINSLFNAASFIDTTAIGFYVGSRTTSTLITLYKNGTSRATDTNSTDPNAPIGNIYLLARNDVSGPAISSGFGNTVKQASIGAGLTGAQVTSFYNRVNAW